VTDSRDKTAAVAQPSAPASDARQLPELYQRYRAELVAFVRAKFGAGPPEPEDVAQQAFANFAAQGRHETIANPRAFLFRIAHNLVINERKHQQVGRRFLETAPDPQEICEARDDFNPEVVLSGRQRYRLIEQVIRGMPEKRRRILLLNRLEGLSYAEIGRRLGLSESVVRKHAALAVRECAAVLLDAQEPGRKDFSDHD
jgi:RNA polymerase sigma-70 factor (ECF subfamily)